MSPRRSKTRQLGRPPRGSAVAHTAIMDAVYTLLSETSVRDLTMEAVAKRAGVGKPTLYKWWPTKAALVLAMFHERLAEEPAAAEDTTAEDALRAKVFRLVDALGGLFGKVMAELIAEGQSDQTVLSDLWSRHIRPRRAAALADIRRGMANGEFEPNIDAELLLDEIVGAIYYRLLLPFGHPPNDDYADCLMEQALRGLRAPESPRR